MYVHFLDGKKGTTIFLPTFIGSAKRIALLGHIKDAQIRISEKNMSNFLV